MDSQPFLKKNIVAQITLISFIVLAVWWVTIYARGLQEGSENNGFTLLYPCLSLFGSIMGITIAKKWGGLKSYFGLALTFLSLGLFAQFFGQASYAYFIYIKSIEVPYPSFGDIGYFGSVFFYLIAVLYLIKVSGSHVNLKSLKGAIISVLIPILMLVVSYYIFLKGYRIEDSSWLKVFLDFGYPLGQAIYVSLALLALLLSRNILGGVMKKPIILLIFALVAQYVSDFTFLYQANQGTWYVGGINDFMYLTSYFLMTLALVYIGGTYKLIQNES